MVLTTEDPSSIIIEIKDGTTDIKPLIADEGNEVKETLTDEAKVEVEDPNENIAGNTTTNAYQENEVKETVTDQAKVDPDKDNPTLNTDEEEAKDTASDKTLVGAHDAIQGQTSTSESVVDTSQNKSDLAIENSKGEGSNEKLEDQSQTTSDQLVESAEEKLEVQVKEQNPIMEKLLMFVNDPRQKTLKFSHDISTHDRIMVHKFVQDNNLTCESTGNNRNHEFVVGKVMIDRFMAETFAQESTLIRESSSNNTMNESADDEFEELDYGSEMDEVEMAEHEEDSAALSHDPEDIVELHTDTQVGMVKLFYF